MIKCIVFDFGGVLFVPGGMRIWAEQIGEKYGVAAGEVEKIMWEGWQHWEIDNYTEDDFFSFVAKNIEDVDKKFLRRRKFFSAALKRKLEEMGLV